MIGSVRAHTLDDALASLGQIAAENEERGRKTLVFCEDRLTLLAEKAVLAACGGTFFTEVTTFRRFLSRDGRRSTLSKQGSVLEIAALLSEYAGELSCFSAPAAQAIYETIAQLSASCVDENLLKNCAEETGGMLGKKLADLAFLLEKYHGFLTERGLLDENGYLALLPGLIRRERETDIVFFAFPAFTRQARLCLAAAMEGPRNVTGIFLDGKENYFTGEAARIFAETAERFGTFSQKEAPSSLGGDAKILAHTIFSTEAIRKIEGHHVRTFTPSDETEEMNTVAALIRKKVAEGKRYRDIAVLVGGEDYFLPAMKAFREYKIPYYADVKRPFSQHPFAQFALTALRAVSGGGQPDDVDALAASPYFGEGGLYRNYLLRYGAYRGAYRRAVKEPGQIGEFAGARDELVAAREKMVAVFDLFKGKTEAKGSFYTDAIRKLYALTEGDKVTSSLSASLEKESVLLDVTPLEGILREAEEVAGDRVFRAREFAALLESGMKALTVSILPRCADAVFVGDITESKICRADVLFAAGLSDDVPRVSQDTAVITDSEIEGLSRLEVEIEPAIAVVNARAREALALNLTSFREELYVSCPRRRKGSEAVRSEALYFINKTFQPTTMSEVFPFDCCEPVPAVMTYLAEREKIEAGGARFGTIERFSSLGEVLRSEKIEVARREEKDTVAEAAALYAGRGFSPTLFEDYFDCPYSSFMRHALALHVREERSVEAADAGNFVHTVLERVARQFNTLQEEAECVALARAEGEALLGEPAWRSLSDTAAGSYTGKRLVEEGVAVSLASFRQIKNSLYRVKDTEVALTLKEIMSGKADRVDESAGGVRIIDYKTGTIDDSPLAYYTGRRLQLELYLLAASEGTMPAGAFYFPADNDYISEKDDRFRMRGFYCNDPQIVEAMDPSRKGKGRSENFVDGSRAEKGLGKEAFGQFLHYAVLVSQRAKKEMAEGNIAPSPYDDACDVCRFHGLCGFAGEPRKEKSIKCGEIARIAKEAEE